jgi:hypothetical protein
MAGIEVIQLTPVQKQERNATDQEGINARTHAAIPRPPYRNVR